MSFHRTGGGYGTGQPGRPPLRTVFFDGAPGTRARAGAHWNCAERTLAAWPTLSRCWRAAFLRDAAAASHTGRARQQRLPQFRQEEGARPFSRSRAPFPYRARRPRKTCAVILCIYICYGRWCYGFWPDSCPDDKRALHRTHRGYDTLRGAQARRPPAQRA